MASIHLVAFHLFETWTDRREWVELRSHLHGYRKVILGLWGKEHVDCFLCERLVASWWGSHFDDVQLQRGTKTKTTTTNSWDTHQQRLFLPIDYRHQPVTFPPAWPLTAKQNRVDSSVLPSILNWAKLAAWPSMGWETFRSTEYSCMAPTTRFCWKRQGNIQCNTRRMKTQDNIASQRGRHITWAEMPISRSHFCLASVR